MKQAIPRQPIEITTSPPKKLHNILHNIIFGGVIFITFLIVISLLTYHPEDSAWSKTIATSEVKNWLGQRGAFFSDVLFITIGKAAWLIPILIIGYAYRLIYCREYSRLDTETLIIRLVGIILMLVTAAALFNLYNPNGSIIDHGGAIGQLIAVLLTKSIGWLQIIFPDSFVSISVSKVILFCFLFMTAIMASGTGPLGWIDTIGAFIIKGYQFMLSLFREKSDDITATSPELANIEHLMEPEAAPTESKSKFAFFSSLIPTKGESEPSNSALASEESHQASIQPITDEPVTAKTEPSFAVNSPSSTVTPKFEPQTDERGEPKLPSIFKRPTIKSTPQDEELTEEELRIKNLADWADNTTQPAQAPVAETTIEESAEIIEPITPSFVVDTIFSADTKTESTSFQSQPEITVPPVNVSDEPRSMFSQAPSEPTFTKPLSTANLHEDDQDFDAFIESLEKYHSPVEPTMNEIVEDTKIPEIEIIEEAFDNLPQFEMINEQENNHPSSIEDTDLPSVNEIIEQPINDKIEPNFTSIAPPVMEEISVADPIPTPSWEPFTPEPEPIIAIPEPIIAPEPITPIAPAQPINNIVMPTVPMPVEMSAAKKAELLKHFPMAGQLPPLNLLGDPPPVYNQYDIEELNDMAQLIEEQLKNFSIKVSVANIEPGPVVTRFELELAPGVKVAQINNLEKDIARGLSVTSVRVVDIIPGTSYVGLEIPNRKREIVYFKSGLESKEYQEATDPLTLILGKSISGEPVLANLAKMPHVLVAGTTGSGKSVGVNTMLLSMLFKATPEELRLILIDPKMLELSVYNDIPHLLIPVITDMKESANALRWCVAEMERRYMLMSQLKVRNIAGYNQKIQEALDAGQPIIDPLWRRSEHVSDTENPPLLEKLPFIVVVIDEFADMMMLVGKKCEELIARLAQKARASGIHLILATQRPSVDVITGLIKANIPTRIAFQVSSKIDSRTIIDQQGAETLLGHGDMLYAPSGINVPIRVHGAFVDDHEVNKVAEFLKLTGEPDYIEDILQEPTEAIPGLSPEASGVAAVAADDQDPLFDEAVKIVVESRRASISYIQRKLRVGYQRAARLMEEMEELRIVTPPQSNGNREVLMAAENNDF